MGGTRGASRCPVGGNIQALLLPVFDAAQSAMEGYLAAFTLQDLIDRLPGKKRGH
jgi:hypothetical protein